MARGSVAKEHVEKKIAVAFGDAFIGMYDKKLYVWANDGGEQVQIAISLTCPKVPIEVDKTVETSGDWDFTDDGPKMAIAVTPTAPAEITEEEINNLEKLMERLGL
jgi:hypothetical protein